MGPEGGIMGGRISADMGWGRCFVAIVLLALLPTGAFAAQTPTLVVQSDGGVPIAGATVTFHAAQQPTTTLHTDALGRVAAPFGPPVDASVRAAGYHGADVHITSTRTTIVTLATDLKVIGKVTVATGSPHDLHTLPVTALALDSSTVRAIAPTTADGLLSALPGFDEARSNSTVTNPTQLRASIGGAGQDRGLVLVDALPAENGFGGWIEWPAIAPLDIAGVELLRDAASALYGSGAIGGVVEIRTLQPSTAAQDFADLAVGANGGSEATVSASGAVGDVATRLFVSRHFDGGYRAAPPGFQSSIDGMSTARTDDVDLAVRVPFEKGRSLDVALRSFDHFQDTGRPNYYDEESGWQEALSYRAAAGGSTWQLSAFARNGTLINAADMFPAKPGAPLYLQTIPTNDDGAVAAWSHAWSHDVLRAQTALRVINGSYTQVSPTSGALQSRGGGRQTLASLALSDELQSGRFDIIGAVHGETVATTGFLTSAAAPPQRFGAGSPFVAVRYSLSPAIAFHASEGTGFRAPFLNELYRGFRIGAQQFNTNPVLGPEHSVTRNIGLDAIVPGGRLFGEVTGTRVNDAIAFVTTAMNVAMRENVERTATDGYEVGWQGEAGRSWSLRASYVEQYARVVAGPAADLGKRLAFIPDREGNVTVIAHWPSGIGFALSGTLLGQAYADDLNLEPLGTALVLNASLIVPLSRSTTLSLHANNFTGASYLTSVDRLGPPPRLWLELRADLPRQRDVTRR